MGRCYRAPMPKLMSFIGLLGLMGIAWVFSDGRKQFPWRTVFWGLGLQFILGVLVLGVPAMGIPGVFRFVFEALNDLFMKLIGFTDKGAEFLFGRLLDSTQAWGFLFAFKVLPSIIFFSSLTAILYHLGVLQRIVNFLAKIMVKTLGTSGAEALSTAGNIFLGQTEAPLLIRPFVPFMTRSELFLIMAGGMANTAGGVLAAYVGLLSSRLPDIAGHLITMSVLSAPASVVICKIMVPEREVPQTSHYVALGKEKIDANVIEAAARGTTEGLQLALNVAAMLIAFIALIATMNGALGWIGTQIGFPALSMQWILGWLFSPIAWCLGIPWSEAATAGSLPKSGNIRGKDGSSQRCAIHAE
jgi:concentrative nucleoside transporter, CNT family